VRTIFSNNKLRFARAQQLCNRLIMVTRLTSSCGDSHKTSVHYFNHTGKDWTNNNMYHITVKVRSSHRIGYHCGNKTIVRRKVRLWRKTDRCHDQSKPNFRPLKHKASKHQQPLYMCYVVFKDVVRFYLPWSALDGYHGHGVYSALDCLAGQTALKTVCWGQSSRKTS